MLTGGLPLLLRVYFVFLYIFLDCIYFVYFPQLRYLGFVLIPPEKHQNSICLDCIAGIVRLKKNYTHSSSNQLYLCLLRISLRITFKFLGA